MMHLPNPTLKLDDAFTKPKLDDALSKPKPKKQYDYVKCM
jgi:hypothetical protein